MRGEDQIVIFLMKEGREIGPLSPEALRMGVELGTIQPHAPAWTSHDRRWRSAGTLLKEFEFTQDRPISPAPPLNPPTTSSGVRRIPKRRESVLAVALIALAFVAMVGGFLLYSASSSSLPESGPDLGTGTESHGAGIAAPPDNGQMPREAVCVEEAERCVLMAVGKDGRGTAFIATIEGRTYVYTNVHVASIEGVRFNDFRGNQVKVSSEGEVVGPSMEPGKDAGVDIARFPIDGSPEYSLRFATRELTEKRPEVWALGDSGGQGVLKVLQGRVNGVGPEKIEVTCEFIPGNSGGPIVTTRGEVVGVASYLTTDRTIWAKGTEQEVRRMAWIPGVPYDWAPTSFERLAEESQLVVGCETTSALLVAISMLRCTEEGLVIPEEEGEFISRVLEETEGHPLREGVIPLLKDAVPSNGVSPRGKAERFLELIRFLHSCGDYQESQIKTADRSIQSSFWTHRFQGMLPMNREILGNFKSAVDSFEKEGRYNRSLVEP